MGMISEIGRKSFKVRLLLGAIYCCLLAGSVFMVYPFWLMLSGTSKSGVDVRESSIIPSFIIDKDAFYRKGVEALFNESSMNFQSAYSESSGDFQKIQPPLKMRYKFLDEWGDFIKSKNYPFYYFGVGYTGVYVSGGTNPMLMREFKSRIYQKYQGDIELMNRELGTDFIAWNAFRVSMQPYLERRCMPDAMSKFNKRFYEFCTEQPFEYRFYFSPEGFYKTIYLMAHYTRSIEVYNQAHATSYSSWDQVKFPRAYPADKNSYTDQERADWADYVRNVLNLFWIRADSKALPVYQEYLQSKYPDIAELNRLYGSNYKSHADIPLVEEVPFFGSRLSDWASFIQGWYNPLTNRLYQLPLEMTYINSTEFDFRDHLKAKFTTINAVNKEFSTSFRDWLDIFPPQQEYHCYYLMKDRNALTWEFLKRNFVTVADYILLHGRGVLNTFIYCAIAILCSLIVNPLAAYALSRYRPPSSYKVLLFLMLTMAFPPMVTQIPNFLLLRELGLLNTFAALILPAMANGYSIFLLKGFFDSLPQDIYESAEIDGAGEFRVFFCITMSLSKPILAVIALNAFLAAYSNFMMALLVCQDQNMWTLMPWLYQLQNTSCTGIILSSLIIAAIPTFIIFTFCQNIIMRGLILPVEK